MSEIVDVEYKEDNPQTPQENALGQSMHIARTIYADVMAIHYKVEDAEVLWGEAEGGKPAFGFNYKETDDNDASYLNFISDVYRANNIKLTTDVSDLRVLYFEDLQTLVENIDKLLIMVDAKNDSHQSQEYRLDPEEEAERAAQFSASYDDVDRLFTFSLDHLKKSIYYFSQLQAGTQAQYKTSDGFHIH